MAIKLAFFRFFLTICLASGVLIGSVVSVKAVICTVGGNDTTQTISGTNCTLTENVTGADGGAVSIAANTSFTVGAGQTLAFTTSMTLGSGATIALNSTATIKKGFIYVTDADGDGYRLNSASDAVFSTSAVGGKVRRYLVTKGFDGDDAYSCPTDSAVAGTCGYCNNGGRLFVAAGSDTYTQCTAAYNACSGDNRIGPDGNCNGAGACNTTGLSAACSTAGTCQAGGGCSAGTCTAVTNVTAGTDPNNQCTAVYNACSGNNRIGPDGNCNGAGACNTAGLSSACAVKGTCQTGGGCSAGTCVAVTNQTAAQDLYNECTAVYNACSGNNRIGPDGFCSGTGASCKTTGLSSACAVKGTCQTGGGCSAGTCVAVTNQTAAQDLYNECTATAATVRLNSGTGDSCNTKCATYTHQNALCNGSGACATHAAACIDVGTDAAATNNTGYDYINICWSGTITCSTTSTPDTHSCGGHVTPWTNCLCQ